MRRDSDCLRSEGRRHAVRDLSGGLVGDVAPAGMWDGTGIGWEQQLDSLVVIDVRIRDSRVGFC